MARIWWWPTFAAKWDSIFEFLLAIIGLIDSVDGLAVVYTTVVVSCVQTLYSKNDATKNIPTKMFILWKFTKNLGYYWINSGSETVN